MNLQFLSPLYILGILGISLPIMVHMLTRRQQTRIPFSAVYLLLQSQRRTIKRAQPNRLLLLLIRSLAIACLSFALARPIFSFGSVQKLVSLDPSANVIILDDSFSMGNQAGKENIYANALVILQNLLDKLPEKSMVAWVSASKPARVKRVLERDIDSFRKRVLLSKASYRTTDIGSAFKEAVNILESSPLESKQIYLLTDMDKNGWVPENFPSFNNLKHLYGIHILDVSGFQARTNQAAIQEVEVNQEFLTDSRIIRVKTSVQNLIPDKSIQNLRLELWVNGQKKSESFLDIPQGSKSQKVFSFPLTGSQSIAGYVEIEGDGLVTDNRRYFTFNPDRKLKALLVDGDPKTVAHQSEIFYLERALNPFYSSVSDIEPTVSTLSELSLRNLQQYSVLILCNIRLLPPLYELELEKFVMRGGSLLITLGDQVDPKYYNEKLGNLLPVVLEALNQVDDHDEPFFLDLKAASHPVLKAFDRKIVKDMETIPFRTIFSVNSRNGEAYIAPVTFKNKYPAVVESELGKGRVLLFVSSIDRDWNQFPIQPTFLPWVQRWVKYAARSLENLTFQNLLVGDSFRFKYESGDTVYIRSPKGSLYELLPDNIAFQDTFVPGNYSVFQSHSRVSPGSIDFARDINKIVQLPQNAEPSGGFSVNVNVMESISEKITPESVRKIFPGILVNITSNFDAEEESIDSPGMPMATPALIFVGLALLWEGWLVRRE